MEASCFYTRPVESARLRVREMKRAASLPVLYGPVGIPERLRATHYSPAAVKQELFACRARVVYSVALGDGPVRLNLDAAIPEATRDLFAQQFSRLGRLTGEEGRAVDELTLWSVPTSPALVQRVGEAEFAVNQLYFSLTAFLFSDGMIFHDRDTAIQYPDIVPGKVGRDWCPKPYWLPARTRLVHRENINQALQALVLPLFAAVLYGDCSLERFLMRAHQIMSMYAHDADVKFKGTCPPEAPEKIFLDLPLMTRFLWEYVGAFLYDQYLIDRLWAPRKVGGMCSFDYKDRAEIPKEFKNMPQQFQNGFLETAMWLRQHFLGREEASARMAELRQDRSLDEQFKLGALRALWEFIKEQCRFYGGHEWIDCLWDHNHGHFGVGEMAINERPNPRYCFNVWKPGGQLAVRDDFTPGYKKLLAVFSQLTVARWGHINSPEHQAPLYEDRSRIPSPEHLEQLIDGLYRDFSREDVHNAVLMVLRGYETEEKQFFPDGIDLARFSDHSRYKRARPFRCFVIGDAHVLWAQWLVDRGGMLPDSPETYEGARKLIESHGYPMPYFDWLLGLHTHEFQGWRYRRDPETGWLLDSKKSAYRDLGRFRAADRETLKRVIAVDPAKVVILDYDGMQLLDSQPLFFDFDFMRIISQKDPELFDRIIAYLIQPRECHRGDCHREVQLELDGQAYKVSLYGNSRTNLLEIIKLAYPEIFALIKTRKPDLDQPLGELETAVFGEGSIHAFDNSPEVFNAYLLGRISVTPQGAIAAFGRTLRPHCLDKSH